ncbi:MAG: nucleotidyltransferase family protein [Thermomicrobiales bacterium]|nr:nucleotidyltransferase family protein [Thermomicrobiales bacterium]
MSQRSPVAGIVLAAGRSTRLGRPKQLLPLAGRPLLGHTVDAALGARLSEVIVVLGCEAEAISATLDVRSARIVVNPRFADGQSTSLIAGLNAVAPDAAGAMFLLGDQPQIGSALLDALIDAFARSNAPIVAPLYGGIMGNPVLFDRAMFPALTALTGDEGARSIVRADPGAVLRVPVGDGPPPRDVDTEADYQALLAAWPAGAAR